MMTQRFPLVILFTLLFMISGLLCSVSAQETKIPDGAVVTVVGGGGFPFESEKIFTGGSIDNFDAVYTASGAVQINLKDVYITDNMAVITLSLNTEQSASNHVSSSALFVNGHQRLRGGGAGDTVGGPYERTLTYVFYGGLPEAKFGTEWESLRVSFDGLIFAAYQGTESGFIGVPENYSWSYVFHNPEVSRDNSDELAPAVDERGIHTFGSSAEIELDGFSAENNLTFEFVRKSDTLNNYGSQTAAWIDDAQQVGDGSGVSFDEANNAEIDADTRFVQSDHFLYESDLAKNADSLAVWVQSITIELNADGVPNTWTRVLNDDWIFPLKLVQFKKKKCHNVSLPGEFCYITKFTGINRTK